MPKHLFQATAEGLPKIERRKLLQTFAAVGALCAMPESSHAVELDIVERPEDRLRLHLEKAAATLNEIVCDPSSRWILGMARTPDHQIFITIDRIDQVDRQEADGIKRETISQMMRWLS